MEVVRHDGVGGNVYAEYLRLVEDELFDPASAVFKATTFAVATAEECSSYAARYAVVVGCCFERDQLLPWLRHPAILLMLANLNTLHELILYKNQAFFLDRYYLFHLPEFVSVCIS